MVNVNNSTEKQSNLLNGKMQEIDEGSRTLMKGVQTF